MSKYSVGDLVRVSKAKAAFTKGYTSDWSKEIFKIIRISTFRRPPVYILQDLNHQDIDGIFYAEELSKAKIKMALQKDEFHIILPSNSSMVYFPDNTTTRFITQLSHPLKLTGEWSVSLEEISIPMNFLNLPVKHATVLFTLIHNADLLDFFKVIVTDVHNFKNAENYAARLPPGVYQRLDHLIAELNKLVIISKHIKWELNLGGYIEATVVLRGQL